MIRRLGVLGLAAAMLTSVGCPGCPELDYTNPLRPTEIQRWDFDLGSRGGGSIQYSTLAPDGSNERGECLTPVCHTKIEDKAQLDFTASAASGSRFTRWDGDPARGLSCDTDVRTTATIRVTVTRSGACFAVFEVTGGSGPTTPGAR